MRPTQIAARKLATSAPAAAWRARRVPAVMDAPGCWPPRLVAARQADAQRDCPLPIACQSKFFPPPSSSSIQSILSPIGSILIDACPEFNSSVPSRVILFTHTRHIFSNSIARGQNCDLFALHSKGIESKLVAFFRGSRRGGPVRFFLFAASPRSRRPCAMNKTRSGRPSPGASRSPPGDTANSVYLFAKAAPNSPGGRRHAGPS